MRPAYGFGMSQEDERTEAAALDLRPGDRVFCIASAGEMPLSLLALGAGEVVAVDSDLNQLHLVALKLAAVRALPRLEALRFLGYLPASGRERLAGLAALAEHLPQDARRFWSGRAPDVAAGVIWRGRYERYLRLVRALARPLLGRRHIEALFGAPDLGTQRSCFERGLGRSAVRALFHVAFHPRLYATLGMDPRSLAQRGSRTALGEEFFQRFRAFCTRRPARENSHLQLTLLGRLLDPDVAPACLTAAGAAAIRQRHHRLQLRCGDAVQVLRGERAGRFDKVHLSNLADWLAPAEFDVLLREVARVACPGRAVWRALHVSRSVPAELAATMRADVAQGERLAASDRFPFYRIVPVAIGAAAT